MVPNCWIARTDIRWYYRHFPIDPAHWEYTLFAWQFLDGVVIQFLNLEIACITYELENKLASMLQVVAAKKERRE